MRGFVAFIFRMIVAKLQRVGDIHLWHKAEIMKEEAPISASESKADPQLVPISTPSGP